MKYRIKQLKKDKESKLFQWCSWVKDKFDLNDYEVVYEGEIDGNSTYECLEQLFYIFNQEHPEDFKGHSLSVSDIVELDGGNFYCDSHGWVNVEEALEN
jgi:hypothetical protein